MDATLETGGFRDFAAGVCVRCRRGQVKHKSGQVCTQGAEQRRPTSAPCRRVPEQMSADWASCFLKRLSGFLVRAARTQRQKVQLDTLAALAPRQSMCVCAGGGGVAA